MSTFCGNCGSPLGVNSAFCPQCGAAAGNRPQPPGAPVPPPAPIVTQAPAAKSSPILKIVLVVCCVLAVGAAAVVGGAIYLAHRVKQAVVQKAAENGVDLSSLAHSSAERRKLPKVCELLPKEDVSQLIGEPIDRAEVQDAMCRYYGPPGLSAKLAQEKASGVYKQSQVPGAKLDGSDVATSVDQMVNSLAAPNGQTVSGGEKPLLMVGLDADGKAEMAALSASKAIFSGIGKAADGNGGFGADIPGLGDKAIRIPKLGLNVLEGDVLIRIIPGPFPNSDAKTISVARALLPKI